MAEHVSAEIIPFPVAARPLPLAPQDRLSTALLALSTALTEQQKAVKRWRDAMDDLSGCMRKLSTGLEQVDHSGNRAS